MTRSKLIASNAASSIQRNEDNNRKAREVGHCDGCDKARRDVRAVGRDANGDPDAPDLCFLCRREASRGRAWDRETGSYMHTHAIEARSDARQQ